tara:strand:+ start:83 stop:454 length:372 start_codon:yes stop_codon:yes gene_type:complete
MKITKSKLKIIIEQEIRALLEGEVVPVDFKNKTKRGRPNSDISLGAPDEMPEDEIPLEKTIKAMRSDFEDKYGLIGALLASAKGDAKDISELSRGYDHKLEVDMLERIAALEKAEEALNPLDL